MVAALIGILLEVLGDDAMSSGGFSIGTAWATGICKEESFISRIQVHPHGTRTSWNFMRLRLDLVNAIIRTRIINLNFATRPVSNAEYINT